MRSTFLQRAVLVAALFLPVALQAGPNCAGCPQAAVCQTAKAKAPGAPGSTCSTKGPAAPVTTFQRIEPQDGKTWTRVSMPAADIVKIEAKGEEQELLKTALKERFQDLAKAGKIRFMVMRDQLWVRTAAAEADLVERFLEDRQSGQYEVDQIAP